MQTMRGARPPMLAVATATSHDQNITRLRRPADIHEGGRSLDDIAHTGRPNDLAIAGADFFDVMTQGSLDEIELLALLNDQRLAGPTSALPGSGVAISESRLA